MDNVKLECTIETRISVNTGKPYKVGIIKIADGVEKLVFFNRTELKLIELSN